MEILANLDLLSVGIAMSAIGILGFAVFWDDRKSETNRAFLMLSLMTIGWSVLNYLSYEFSDPLIVIWLIRTAVFFAVLYAYYVFHFAYVFPKTDTKFPRWYLWGILPITLCTAFLNLTPFVFKRVVDFFPDGRVSTIENGPGIAVFGAVVLILNFFGLYLLVKKAIQVKKEQRIQYVLISVGLFITLCLISVFNFVFPAILNNATYVPFGAVFIFPFIAFTAYAIIKHKLLNVKVISTEILTFVLSVAVLFEALLSESASILLFRVGVFLLVLSIGIMLIKSVRKEVEQREQVTKLAESLETANIRLQELDRQKTEFLSIASHQLRTPLSIIKGYLELIRDGAYGKISKKMIPTLDNMDESNERLIHLIDEFLNISRIEQGRTKFTFDVYQINDTVTSVVNELVERAAEKGMSVSWKPKTDIPTFTMDEEKIRHVVFNFVDNAIKYSVQGTVKVTLDEDTGGVVLRVKDDGLGFNKDDEANFYQKFYRGKNVEGTNVNGTGLGLFVCRKFIEAHGGRVWAKSPGLGKGSEFGFWIPMSKEAPKTIEVSESPAAKTVAKV